MITGKERELLSKPGKAMPNLETLKQCFAQIPIMETLDFSLDEVREGVAIMRLRYSPTLDGVFKSLHGGLMMTLADTAACAAVMTLTGTNDPITTTDMSIRFLAPCRTDCLAEATVIKFGRSLVPVEIKLKDEPGTLVAIAQVTYMRLKSR